MKLYIDERYQEDMSNKINHRKLLKGISSELITETSKKDHYQSIRITDTKYKTIPLKMEVNEN